MGARPEFAKTIVIALVENVLQYEQVGNVTGENGVWIWKRNTPFEGL